MTKKQKIKKHFEDNSDAYAVALIAGSYVTLFGALVWGIVKTTNDQVENNKSKQATYNEYAEKYNEYLEAQTALTNAKADQLSGE